jgi:hypothetical protein
VWQLPANTIQQSIRFIHCYADQSKGCVPVQLYHNLNSAKKIFWLFDCFFEQQAASRLANVMKLAFYA